MVRRFTILGESGSGKTCYLLGMYNAMLAGIAGFSLKADDEQHKELDDMYDLLDNPSRGKDRFPEPTDQSLDYTFKLFYSGRIKITTFNWIDYPGTYIKSGSTNDKNYISVKDSINDSDMLFICVDGQDLVDDVVQENVEIEEASKIEEKANKIRKKCASKIMRFYSDYVDENYGSVPPISIVVTKYDLWKKSINTDELREIIQQAFDTLFYDENLYVTIIPVSLGADIANNAYKGKLAPENIHLPILLGVKSFIVSEIAAEKATIDKAELSIARKNSEVRQKQESRDDAKEKKTREENKFFLIRKDQRILYLAGEIKSYDREIESLFSDIASDKNKLNASKINLKNLQRNLDKMEKELSKIKLVFCNGKWQGQDNNKEI